MKLKKNSIYFLIIFLILISLVSADTTFFDNSNDFFIMSSSATTVVITGGTIGQTDETIDGKGGCRYEWNCTNWSKCLSSGKQIRNCTNIGTCSDTYKTPKMEQNCIYTSEGKIIWKEIVYKNKRFIYFFIIILIISFVIFYLKKNYFKS